MSTAPTGRARFMRVANLIQTGLLAGVVFFSVGIVSHFAMPILVPALRDAYAEHPNVFRPWHGWTRAYMLCHPFVYGFMFAVGFHVFHTIKKKNVCCGTKGGAMYGTLVFAIGSLPVFVLNFASFRVPAIVIASWIIQNFLQYLGAGAVLGCATDGAVVRVSTELAHPADKVWEKLKKRSTFLYITRPVLGYPGSEMWPEELFIAQTSISMRVSLLHALPSTPHEVEVVMVDESSMQIETRERSGFVEDWEHCMRVDPIRSDRCRYTDSIEINAGWLTPAAWVFASVFYRYRHMRWRKFMRRSSSCLHSAV